MFTKAQFVAALKGKLPEVFTTKASADKAFDAFCSILAEGIADGGIRLPNVGSFSVSKRAARTGRNPQTGATIKIAAKKVVKFSTAKALTDQLN
ncbi:MAG: HU family DNA-binding protein [Desulfovibrionaceae bacterium]|jgi:DNA-binding protein HU-beta|nr:HU family DNA-binding protein [Desulfovibrionaceae bacterium]